MDNFGLIKYLEINKVPMLKNVVYSELENLTEKEFFRRELGLNIIFNSNKDTLKNEKILMIASSNPIYWRDFLNLCNDKSVIFFLVGNETYEPEIFNALNGLNSLKHVFVYNPPHKIKLITIIKTFIGNLMDHSKATSPFINNPIRELLISLHLVKKFVEIKMEYEFSVLPQGYSNNFAVKFTENFKLSPSQSLIDKTVLDLGKNLSDRDRFIGFSGQQTNHRRFIMIQSAMKYMEDLPDMTEGFRGAKVSGDLIYLNQLLNCKLVLVPPGFFNNSNHRYTESLICGALPVILAKNSLDPSENNNWTNCLWFPIPYSSKSLLRYLSWVSDDKIKKYLRRAQKDNFDEILQFRKKFLSLV
jgi:hypothetical protein